MGTFEEARYRDMVKMAPQPEARGSWKLATRLRIISDGIEDCIKMLPLSYRAVQSSLQRAWVDLECVRTELAKEEAPECQNQLPL